MEWTPDQLAAINDSEELTIVARRPDHEPLRVPVWVVVAAGEVFVRSYKGPSARWFKRVNNHPLGAISLGGPDIEVEFVPYLEEALDTDINDAYRVKYSRFDYVTSMWESKAVESTLLVRPV